MKLTTDYRKKDKIKNTLKTFKHALKCIVFIPFVYEVKSKQYKRII